MNNTPDSPAKCRIIAWPRVETIRRCLPRESGKFCTLFYTSETFKQIITGEPLMVRDVYRRAFEFMPCAQHVYATNNLPSFKGGMDRGVRRRLMVLTFNRVIPRHERIERIGQRIGEQEADLLLVWAVRGASRVLAAQAFTTPTSSAAALLDWMYSSDPVLAWLESDEVEFTANNFTPETQVKVAHGQFVRWACGEGFDQHRLPAVNGFSQRVEAAGKGVTKKRANTGSRFVGLACIGPGSEAVTRSCCCSCGNSLKVLR